MTTPEPTGTPEKKQGAITRFFEEMLDKKLLIAAVLLGAAWLAVEWIIAYPPKPIRFDDYRLEEVGAPAAQMTILASRIYRYAADHDGKYPDSLDRLHPDYLEGPAVILNGTEKYKYKKDEKQGFILTIYKPSRFGFNDLVFNGDSAVLDVGAKAERLFAGDAGLMPAATDTGAKSGVSASRPTAIAPAVPQEEIATPTPEQQQGPTVEIIKQEDQQNGSN